MIQLRIRTEYSFGQTYAPLEKLVARLKEIGCTAAGMVDIGSTWGHVKWYKVCKAAGIQPLLGVELVVTDEEDQSPSMWFLARNTAGLQELYRWSSKTFQQPVAGKRGSIPALRRADVLNMSDNIFKFAGDITDAKFLQEAGAYADISPGSRVLALKKRNLGLSIVGVSDNYYMKPEDDQIFELLGGAKKPSPQCILTELEGQDIAIELAKQCEGLELPKAPILRAAGDLEALCREGIKFRNMNWTDKYEQRLKYELELIKSKDYDAYFIVVSDMVVYAKKHMIVGPSRGSSAGSLVCYLARITEIDPVPPKLMFERFIDITRSDLPDIDLDFPDNKRHIVFEYMANKYGVNNVAHIGTVSVYKPKSALVQVCNKLNIPASATAGIKAVMIERSIADPRANNCLEDTLNATDVGKKLLQMYPQIIKAIEIEGHASHTSVHAAGLLICNDDVTNYCTVGNNGIAHIDKVSAEDIGLLKIDVLGLRTLSILEDANVGVDWYNLKFDDKLTYDVFNSQRLCGIFQFEGKAMRAVSQDTVYNSISEIDAVTALARPGPFAGGVTEEYIKRKNGKPYEGMHPAVELIMADTYGLPVYQEQTLLIVKEIGNFSWGDTAKIRKAVSKSYGKEYFDAYWIKFKEGAASNGIEEEPARKIWDMIYVMGMWQMNRAHTYSYAVISYWTAFLKAHFPMEFAVANLRNAKDEDSAVQLLREMVNEGLRYVAFDIEKSKEHWSMIGDTLYGGFMNLHGFGAEKAKKFVVARDSGRLTQKMREDVVKAENPFVDLFPLRAKYGLMYDCPADFNIVGDISNIADIKEGGPNGESRVVIGELIHKNARDINEEVFVKKRGGKIESGPRVFLDIKLRDDTGTIGGRVGRKDYLSFGKKMLEEAPIGAHLLVRATCYNGIRFLFIKKWKRLGT